MNKKCVICKYENNCLTYKYGGYYSSEQCLRFIEEPDITEEEQEHRQQEQAKKKSVFQRLFEKIKHN